jgi:hypothetical protein
MATIGASIGTRDYVSMESELMFGRDWLRSRWATRPAARREAFEDWGRRADERAHYHSARLAAPAAVAAACDHEARHLLVLDQMHPLPAHARGRDCALHDPLGAGRLA